MLKKSAQQTMNVQKRDGRLLSFDAQLVARAIEKAFCAELGLKDRSGLAPDLIDQIESITHAVVDHVRIDAMSDAGVSVEQIQDVVERELMKAEHFSVARRYILYRAEHSTIRRLRAEERMESDEAFPSIMVKRDGKLENVNFDRLRGQIEEACRGLSETCSSDELLEEVEKQFFNGITPMEIGRSMVLAARARIEIDPDYDTVAGRLVLNIIYRESLGKSSADGDVPKLYREKFVDFVQVGIEAGRISPELREFDLDRLAAAIVSTRDGLFPYLGLQTIYDRYLLHINGRRFERRNIFGCAWPWDWRRRKLKKPTKRSSFTISCRPSDSLRRPPRYSILGRFIHS